MQGKLLSQNFYLKALNKLNTCGHTNKTRWWLNISNQDLWPYNLLHVNTRHLKHLSIADRIWHNYSFLSKWQYSSYCLYQYCSMIQTLMLSQALFLSLLSFKFFKANLIEILIWGFLSSNTLSFLRLNSSTSNFCAAFLLTASLSQTFAITRQWSVSQWVPLKECTPSTLQCHLLSINMWSTWLWIFPSGEVQVCLWMFWCENIRLLTTRFFDVAELITVTSLPLLSNVNSQFKCHFENILSPLWH